MINLQDGSDSNIEPNSWIIYLKLTYEASVLLKTLRYDNDGMDRIITNKTGRILLWKMPVKDDCILKFASDIGTPRLNLFNESPLFIDLSKSLSLIESSAFDEDASLLEALNFVFDCFLSCEYKAPSSIRRNLHGLADFLTFSNDLEKFFSNKNRRTYSYQYGWCTAKILNLSEAL